MSYHPAKFGCHGHSGSGVSLILVCHVILQKPRDQRVIRFYGWNPLMISHCPAKSGGHSRCGTEDIMFPVAEEDGPSCSRFNPPLLFISKRHGLKEHGISY